MNDRVSEKLGTLVFAIGAALVLALWCGGIFLSAWLATLVLPHGAGIAAGAFAYLFLTFVFIFFAEAGGFE